MLTVTFVSLYKRNSAKPLKLNTLKFPYRPIYLHCIPHKLLERLILMRIAARVDNNIPIYQAGFRPGRSCCDHVYNDRQNTGAAVTYLTAGYNTVWK